MINALAPMLVVLANICLYFATFKLKEIDQPLSRLAILGIANVFSSLIFVLFEKRHNSSSVALMKKNRPFTILRAGTYCIIYFIFLSEPVTIPILITAQALAPAAALLFTKKAEKINGWSIGELGSFGVLFLLLIYLIAHSAEGKSISVLALMIIFLFSLNQFLGIKLSRSEGYYSSAKEYSLCSGIILLGFITFKTGFEHFAALLKYAYILPLVFFTQYFFILGTRSAKLTTIAPALATIVPISVILNSISSKEQGWGTPVLLSLFYLIIIVAITLKGLRDPA